MHAANSEGLDGWAQRLVQRVPRHTCLHVRWTAAEVGPSSTSRSMRCLSALMAASCTKVRCPASTPMSLPTKVTPCTAAAWPVRCRSNVTRLASTPTAPRRTSMRKSMMLRSREPEARSRGMPDAPRQELKLSAWTSAACCAVTGSKGTRPGSASKRMAPPPWPQAAIQGETASAVSLSAEPRTASGSASRVSSRSPSGVDVQSCRQ
mmetsp:Transcript_50277/g.129580  ORF Transcript_50277/g.129580 Transcript_50277/m.129580 type:complete len:207 (-) Transcript_50277:1452-2072(-)